VIPAAQIRMPTTLPGRALFWLVVACLAAGPVAMAVGLAGLLLSVAAPVKLLGGGFIAAVLGVLGAVLWPGASTAELAADYDREYARKRLAAHEAEMMARHERAIMNLHYQVAAIEKAMRPVAAVAAPSAGVAEGGAEPSASAVKAGDPVRMADGSTAKALPSDQSQGEPL
jgi:hypothetical protein